MASSYYNDTFLPVNLFANETENGVAYSANQTFPLPTNQSSNAVDNLFGGGGEGGAAETAALVFMGIAFFIIIFASVCGNLLVIFAVYKNLRLRTKTNVSFYVIISLQVATRQQLFRPNSVFLT